MYRQTRGEGTRHGVSEKVRKRWGGVSLGNDGEHNIQPSGRFHQCPSTCILIYTNQDSFSKSVLLEFLCLVIHGRGVWLTGEVTREL